ncbi:MAG: ferredoxin [Candidatus Omnitrophica bacterium]|nr:ferredoxin [Candidatus Omnitrophota bacterium]MCM8771191.1 ferredoxin [Candidatus Omnitrophota bacterium]
MAKVTVDAGLCVGCGLCEQSCPEVFKLEGDGIAHVIAQSCSIHNLEEIAAQCPVEAIKIK